MTDKPLDQLGKLKRAIVETLWELGEATVRQVRTRIDPEKKMAYTTFLSSMQQLEQSGWLRHHRKGRANVYTPAHCHWKARLASLRRYLERAFKKNEMLLFQALFEVTKLSNEQIAQLEKLIAEHKKRPAGD